MASIAEGLAFAALTMTAGFLEYNGHNTGGLWVVIVLWVVFTNWGSDDA